MYFFYKDSAVSGAERREIYSVRVSYLLQEFMSDLGEQSVHIITIFSRGLQEVHPVPVCKLLPHVSRDLVVVPVDLVTHQDPQYLGRGVLLDLPEPVRTTVECWLVGDVIHEYEGVGRAVVGLGDAPEPKPGVNSTSDRRISPLLACSVPDLQFDLLSVNLNSFDHEVHSDGGSLSRRKHSLGEPPDQAGLAHTSISDQDNLE